MSILDEYIVEINNIAEPDWNNNLIRFEDASIYQTTAFGQISSGGNYLNHMVIKDHDGSLVSMALIRLFKFPIIGKGIAYVFRGPVWKLKDNQNIDYLTAALKALEEEYVNKRKLTLRIAPNLFKDSNENYEQILRDVNFNFNKNYVSRTIILDLSSTLENIRKSFHSKWRNKLNKAERNNLKVISGTDNKYFNIFMKMYHEMLNRKKFKENVSVEKFKEINDMLNSESKLVVHTCYKENKPVSSLICSAMGNTGIYLFGATSNDGLKYDGSYLLQWANINYLKEKGFRYYDLGGIDPLNNKGVYIFKSRLNGKEVNFLGKYDIYDSRISKTAIKLLKI